MLRHVREADAGRRDTGMTATNSDNHETSRPLAKGRQMVPAQLMGSSTHSTVCGINVYIYRRAGKFLARGRYQGRMFGKTLGCDEGEAISLLRRLLTEIEDG